jgi:hypothetical protein
MTNVLRLPHVGIDAPTVRALAPHRAAHATLTRAARELVEVLRRQRMAAFAVAGLLYGVATALRARVRKVIGLRAEKEMIGSHASPVVATVQNEQAVRWGAIRQLVRVAMRTDRRRVRQAELAVSGRLEHAASPQPAGIGLGDTRPKAFTRRSRHTSNLNASALKCHLSLTPLWQVVGAA